MVRYVTLEKDLILGGIFLFRKGIPYELDGEIVLNGQGSGIKLTDIWVDYSMQVKHNIVH